MPEKALMIFRFGAAVEATNRIVLSIWQQPFPVSKGNSFDSRSLASEVGMVLLCGHSPDAPSESEFELKVALCVVSHHSVTSSIHPLALVAFVKV